MLKTSLQRVERQREQHDEAQDALDEADELLDWAELTTGSIPQVDEEGRSLERDERLIRWEEMTSRPVRFSEAVSVESAEGTELELLLLERAALTAARTAVKRAVLVEETPS